MNEPRFSNQYAFLSLILLFIFTTTLSAQQKYTISGYMSDGSTGEKLIGANIFEKNHLQGNVSNTFGFYSLTLPAGAVDLEVSYIGYGNQTLSFDMQRDTVINFDFSTALELETVVVQADKQYRIEEDAQMSRMEIPIEQIKKIPALLGENDVLKALQLLPGVQSGGEGQSGLYVRGGSPDQNLVLLDGVPVYNVSHVLGIFSVFNADAIKNVTLTKGGFPARYGGRLSSVLEINMKEGNMKEFHGEGSIGTISSKLTLEGPIIKDKMSFIVSARRTYIDLIAKPFIALANNANQSQGFDEKFGLKLYFYDLNAKLNYKINDKHRLYLSAYSGADVFGVNYEYSNGSGTDTEQFSGGLDWGNVISSFRWNYKINNKLFANTTLNYSNYNIDIPTTFSSTYENNTGESIMESVSVNYRSGIKDFSGKVDFDYIPNPNNYIRFGANLTHHTYTPGVVSFEAEFEDANIDTLLGDNVTESYETAIYVEDEISLGKLKANVGLHFSMFNVEGETYTSLQPRIGLRYLLPRDVALKASFSTMTQFINLLTSEALSLPTDLWVPSTARVKPQESWQAALGVAKTFDDKYEFSVEAYYKQMNNVISFKEGSSFAFGFEEDWQNKITQGDGEAYGVELFLQKKTGKTTGWIGYTLSWNNRTFEEINGGKTFPFRYDRRHDISIVALHQFNERVSLSAAWIFGTGNAFTLPRFRYPYDQSTFTFTDYNGQQTSETVTSDVESLGKKNNFRMTNYHRLDISLELSKQKKRVLRTWVFGVYNTYFHSNPYFVIPRTIFSTDSDGNSISERVYSEVSILPIIPSVSYKIKF